MLEKEFGRFGLQISVRRLTLDPFRGLVAKDVEIYDSQLQSQDQFGIATKFIPPTVADGRVYVATTTGVAVFGLLP